MRRLLDFRTLGLAASLAACHAAHAQQTTPAPRNARTPAAATAAPPAAPGQRGGASPGVVAKPAEKPAAKKAAPAIDPEVARKKLADLLRLWEEKSKDLETIDAEITRTDKSPNWGVTQYEGRAILKAPNLVFLNFEAVQLKDGKPTPDPKTGKPLKTPYQRIVCTGDEVWEYKNETKQIFVYPLAKEQKQRALEEGPLPFLFRMRVDDANARYTMRLVQEKTTPLGDWAVIEIKPRLDIDKESFSKAMVRLNKKTVLPDGTLTMLPDAILLVDTNEQDTQEYELRSRPNAAVDVANFKAGKFEGWKLERNPPASQARQPSGNIPTTIARPTTRPGQPATRKN